MLQSVNKETDGQSNLAKAASSSSRSLHPKQDLDQCSGFCRVHERDSQIDWETHHATGSSSAIVRTSELHACANNQTVNQSANFYSAAISEMDSGAEQYNIYNM